MGTDIHICAEFFTGVEPDVTFNIAQSPNPNQEQKKWKVILWQNPNYIRWADQERFTPSLFMLRDRNYDVFAMLANVRNGYGFAGVQTGEGFDVISRPRGLPEDISDEAEAFLEHRADHSHSWLLLSEIAEFWQTHKNKATLSYGEVNCEQYKIFKEKGMPESWSGGISGPAIRHINNKEMDAIILDAGKMEAEKEKLYTRICWQETYEQSSNGFFDLLFKVLRPFVGWDNDSSFSKIRIVFGFDS